MASTSSVTTTDKSIINSLNANANATTTKSTAEDIESRFLTMLVTQLKNQDPLNPADANQMTTQLSQISMVSGIEKLNTNMDKLLSAYSSTQNIQAAAMIGKTVLTEGNELSLVENGAIGGALLESDADKVTITIKNSAGKVVQTQKLEDQEAGVVNFYWDGKDSDGNALSEGDYTFSVTAETSAGKEVKATALQAGTVYALSMTTSGVTLQLSDNKTVTYDDIRQIMN